MSGDDALTVYYNRVNPDVHDLSIGCACTPDIRIDYTGIPEDERGGTAARLVAASALYCFASTLGGALFIRGANAHAITGRATCIRGKDERHRSKVTDIKIEIEVDIDDDDLPILERCQKVMREGCLITYSLDTAINVDHVIRRKESEVEPNTGRVVASPGQSECA